MGRHSRVMKEQLDLFEGGGPRGLVPNADLCTSRHHGADTSVEAFKTTPESTRKRQREAVLNFIKAAPNGATCEEVSRALAIPYTAASPRFTELHRLGLIEFGEERRQTTHGKPARVYRILNPNSRPHVGARPLGNAASDEAGNRLPAGRGDELPRLATDDNARGCSSAQQ